MISYSLELTSAVPPQPVAIWAVSPGQPDRKIAEMGICTRQEASIMLAALRGLRLGGRPTEVVEALQRTVDNLEAELSNGHARED